MLRWVDFSANELANPIGQYGEPEPFRKFSPNILYSSKIQPEYFLLPSRVFIRSPASRHSHPATSRILMILSRCFGGVPPALFSRLSCYGGVNDGLPNNLPFDHIAQARLDGDPFGGFSNIQATGYGWG